MAEEYESGSMILSDRLDFGQLKAEKRVRVTLFSLSALLEAAAAEQTRKICKTKSCNLRENSVNLRRTYLTYRIKTVLLSHQPCLELTTVNGTISR